MTPWNLSAIRSPVRAVSNRRIAVYSFMVGGATVLWMVLSIVPPFYVKLPVITVPYVRLPVITVPYVRIPVLTVPSIGVKLPVVRLPDLRIGVLLNDLRGLLACAVLGTARNVREALPIVSEEQKRTAAERDAFAAFARSVWDIDTTDVDADARDVATAGRSRSPLVVEARSTGSSLERVRRAYAETVMTVPHYEEEYDESFATNLSNEFGDDLALAVVEGSHLTSELKQTLVRAAIASRNSRNDFLDVLDEERTSLKRAKRTLERIDELVREVSTDILITHSFDDLTELHRRLDNRRETCSRLLEERQQHRTSGPAYTVTEAGPVDLQSYLYRRLDVRYPVLADGAALARRAEEAQGRIRRALARRV